jgi:hypothetical protein
MMPSLRLRLFSDIRIVTIEEFLSSRVKQENTGES